MFHLELVISLVESFFEKRNKEDSIQIIDRTTVVMRIFKERAAKSKLAQLAINVSELKLKETPLSPRTVELAKNALNDISKMLGERQIMNGISNIGMSKNLAKNAAGATANHGVIHQFTWDHNLNAREKEKLRLSKAEQALKLEYEKGRIKRNDERNKRKKRNTVGVVGYTNVGKSALINSLTNSKELEVKNMYFCTTDTEAKKLICNSETGYVIDTVGFVKNLPLSLYSAFLATLEEVKHCDVIIHVIDPTMPMFDTHRKAVNKTLADAGIVSTFDHKRTIREREVKKKDRDMKKRRRVIEKKMLIEEGKVDSRVVEKIIRGEFGEEMGINCGHIPLKNELYFEEKEKFKSRPRKENGKAIAESFNIDFSKKCKQVL